MEYFCYISRSKVDQFYHTLAPGTADEWTENTSSEQAFGASGGADVNIAHIFSLFKGGITYGRKGVLQKEQKVKIEYVEKLHRVLKAIAAQGPIPSLSDALRKGKLQFLYYHHEGLFRVERPVSAADAASIVTIQTELEGTILLLDCSLRFFSEAKEIDDKFILHSSNARFFSGDIPLRMETVLLLLHQEDGRVLGTPLFLKLEAAMGTAL